MFKSESIAQILSDHGAVRNGMPTDMCSQMHFQLHSTSRRVKNCVFAALRIEVLGYIVSKDGVESDDENVKGISEAGVPQAKKEL